MARCIIYTFLGVQYVYEHVGRARVTAESIAAGDHADTEVVVISLESMYRCISHLLYGESQPLQLL